MSQEQQHDENVAVKALIGDERSPAPDYTRIELFAGDASRQRAEEFATREGGEVFTVEEFRELYPERHIEVWPRIFGVMVEYVVVVQ